MALSPGTRLGPYEVAAPIGAGGMGEVYKATDTRLGRTVAIKVLPEHVAADRELRARFEREARTLSSLNHPHICTIHDVGSQDGTDFLVMEYLEGETLAARLAKGALPLNQALRHAIDIADALDKAHRQGVVHRDLKPGNIMLTRGGAKLLDFGLAKLRPAGSGSLAVSAAPTVTSPLTGAGSIVGTFQYMAPEQLQGEEADSRTDIFAFGAVVYEMVTGQRALEGKTQATVIASILEREPPVMSSLEPKTPPALEYLVGVCLAKDPDDRWQSARDVLRELKRIEAGTAVANTSARLAPPLLAWRVLPWLAGAAVGGLLAWFATSSRPEPAASRARFVLDAPPSARFEPSPNFKDLAISPDGTRVVYTSGSPPQLYVRAVDRLEGTLLRGTENAGYPFFSPSGDAIAFDVGGVLRKIPATGGPVVTLFSSADSFRGGSWRRDDTIVFANTEGIYRIPASGGEAVQLLGAKSEELGRGLQWYPEALPGDRAILFMRGAAAGTGRIFLLDLKTLEERPVGPGASGASPRFSPTGHIVWGFDGTLWAVPFNLERLEITGAAVPVLQGVMTKSGGAGNFDLASNGSLVYVAQEGVGRTVVWVDREGRETSMPGLAPNAYIDVSVSPDGAQVAVTAQSDVWIYDVKRATLGRLTTHPSADGNPLWYPDGTRLVFTSSREGFNQLFSTRADGREDAQRLLTRASNLVDLRANGWSPNGRHVLFTEVTRQITCNLGQLSIESGAQAENLVQDGFCNDYAAVSPDGRWMAYESSRSGRSEIYVERYPGLGGRQQISTAGGSHPLWSPDGRELYFGSLNSRQMQAVSIQGGTTLVASRPRVLFDKAHLPPSTGYRPYDVSRDGRFAMITAANTEGSNGAAGHIIVVQNWLEELKRLVPAP